MSGPPLRDKIGIFRALDSFRRELKRPGENERKWKTNHDEKHNQTDNPIWNVEDWKNLRDTLSESPTGNCIRDGDFVNVAPLQLGKKSFWIHNLGHPHIAQIIIQA